MSADTAGGWFCLNFEFEPNAHINFVNSLQFELYDRTV
jgi:hypothetical protein